MKKMKIQLARHIFYDYSGIQAHLEKMAEQGWLIEKLGKYFWKYRAIEPKKLHIAVTYFADASEFDPTPTEKQLQMEEYCAKDGWRIATRWAQMQIFYNEAETPIPIETDAVTQVETIHTAMKRNLLPSYYFLLGLCVYQLVLSCRDLYDAPVRFLSTTTSLCKFPVWSLLLVSALLELGGYLLWHRRATAAAENGEILEMKTYHMASMILMGIAMLTLVLPLANSVAGRWVLLLVFCMTGAIILIAEGIKVWLKKKGATRNTNRVTSMIVSFLLIFLCMMGIISVVIIYGIPDGRTPVDYFYTYNGEELEVYNDFLPLQIDDLMESEYTEWSFEQQGEESFLISNINYTQWPLTDVHDAPRVEYTVTEIKDSRIYEMCKAGLVGRIRDMTYKTLVITEQSYEVVDATPWGAQDAYQHYREGAYLNRYLLCYDNLFIDIEFNWEPTPEQMRIVAETLAGEV